VCLCTLCWCVFQEQSSQWDPNIAICSAFLSERLRCEPISEQNSQFILHRSEPVVVIACKARQLCICRAINGAEGLRWSTSQRKVCRLKCDVGEHILSGFICIAIALAEWDTKTWTLDWTVDWTLDSTIDSIGGLEFRSPGVKGHLQLISSKAFDVGCRIC